jgi:hypothetical protein
MDKYQKTSEKISGQTQDVPGHEHEMDPQPIFITDKYKGSENLKGKQL